METTLPWVLEDARDIVVVGHLKKRVYVFAAKPSLKFMGGAFEQTVLRPEDTNFPFNAHWQFDKKQGITGSSPYLALRFDRKALRPFGLWLPGYPETEFLKEQGKLEIGVYRDASLAVITPEEPNKTQAQTLTALANESGLELPLIVPFRALDYQINGKDVELSFVSEPKGIISGEEAAKILKSYKYYGNSGVCRAGLCGRGWDSNYEDLGRSSGSGRVGDWVCGEATAQNLLQAYKDLSDRTYGTEITRLREEQESKLAEFERALNN